MNYKIVVDSGCELPKELKNDEHFVVVPLTLIVDGEDIIDDDTFDQADFIKKVNQSKECPKSACPSPERYMQEYGAENTDIYVVTLSSKLSGSYNSALVAADMYEEEGGTNKVHVVDSLSAACGETLMALKLHELAQSGMPFEQVVREIEEYRDGVNTYFVLESLETLRKNGRLSNMQALLVNVLNIKPIMSADKGEIIKIDQARGINKALKKMCEYVAKGVKNPEEKTLTITHCNCYDRAIMVKEELLAAKKYKNIIIMDAAGISTMYENDGGVIVTV